MKTVAISYSDLHGDSRSALLLYSRILETARSDEYRYDSFTRLILRFRIPCHAGKILLIAAIHRSKDTITTIPSSHHLSCILSPFNSSALSRHHHPSIYIYTYILYLCNMKTCLSRTTMLSLLVSSSTAAAFAPRTTTTTTAFHRHTARAFSRTTSQLMAGNPKGNKKGGNEERKREREKTEEIGC